MLLALFAAWGCGSTQTDSAREASGAGRSARVETAEDPVTALSSGAVTVIHAPERPQASEEIPGLSERVRERRAEMLRRAALETERDVPVARSIDRESTSDRPRRPETSAPVAAGSEPSAPQAPAPRSSAREESSTSGAAGREAGASSGGRAAQPATEVPVVTADGDSGSSAAELATVSVSTPSSGVLELTIQGDGAFSYTTFTLADPDRFVIDLAGVVNRFPSAEVSVESEVAERVRVAQFRIEPTPVTRLVVDLVGPEPVVESLGDRPLVLRFSRADR